MSSSEVSLSEGEALITKTAHKTKDKSTKKHKTRQPAVTVTPHGKNEGTDTDWAYKPPEGAALVSYDGDADDFDWDALKSNEDIELWIMRVPEGVKPKYLQGLKLDEPSSSKTARIGSLARKHTTYDVWSFGEDQNDLAGAEEIKSFSCVVPRKKKDGKLFLAPEVTTRHIVLTARPEVPSAANPETDDADMSWSTQQNPPRPTYPDDLLKHRFMPYGSLAPPKESVDAMDVDQPSEGLPSTPHKDVAEKGSPTKKSKKRRDEDGSPKKSKKTKTAAD